LKKSNPVFNPNATMKKSIIAGFLLLQIAACVPSANSRIDLAGPWQFAMDPGDAGIVEKWYTGTLDGSMDLPGSMMEHKLGNVPGLNTPWTGSIYDSSFFFNPAYEKFRQKGNVKFPFWLTPPAYYLGAAWYRKVVDIPADWTGKRVVLHLERPHWQTRVWVNNEPVGMQNSLSTPHEYDVTSFIKKGQNTIAVRVDNRTDKINVGPDSHSVTDHTQGNWNGMVGALYLKAGAPVYIEDMQLYPDTDNNTVTALISIQNSSGDKLNAVVQLQAELLNGTSGHLGKVTRKVEVTGQGNLLEIEYAMGDQVKLWDEFSPNLYRMTASIKAKGYGRDKKQETFGMRNVRAEDGRIFVNGRPVFLRGTLDCCAFPFTGYPPSDVASWRKLFEICKESGLNHVRFHSYCPPEAAFVAADQMGIYLQPEAASWPNHGTSLGDGRPIDNYIMEETERIIKAYGNHPSFLLWAYCNEPYGNYVPFLDQGLAELKSRDSRRIYTAASIGNSWQVNPESEFLVRSTPRGLPFNQQPDATFNYSERIAGEHRPYITHEMGQYCVYPDFAEIDKYTGVYKAKNFEMFRELLSENHMGDQAEDFLMASGKLQALCYKAEIEAQLRTPTLDGFQLLGLTDFPGQGSAIIGMLNVFWEEKGYITKNEISRFCNQTVPLAGFDKFVYGNGEILSVPVKVSHYGPDDLKDTPSSYWIATADGDTIAKGGFGKTVIPTGQLSNLGTIECPLHSLEKAVQCVLEVSVGDFRNRWNFWVFPEKHANPVPDEIHYTAKLDQEAMNILNAGGIVLLDASGTVENGKDIVARFTPVFWNTSWFKMRPPHTTGILVRDDHPAFRDFPTSYHSDYQWWEIVNQCQVMCIDAFPPSFRPLVQPIDTWFLSRRLAQLFEAQVGNGKLVVSTLNLDPGNGPASAQLKQSLVGYMNSGTFMPGDTLDPAMVLELFEKKDRRKVDLYTRGSPEELKPIHQKKQSP